MQVPRHAGYMRVYCAESILRERLGDSFRSERGRFTDLVEIQGLRCQGWVFEFLGVLTDGVEVVDRGIDNRAGSRRGRQ